jgi:subtilase family serine protease
MAHLRLLSLCAVASVLFCSMALTAQDAAPTVRIVNQINENQLTVLKGNTPPAANSKNDRGRVSSTLPMTGMILVLSRSAEQQAAFDKFVASQYDPKSANYRHWLEPEQVGTEFGPAESDVETVSSWLRTHGFTVDEVSPNRMTIRFSGTAALVESAFHTEIHNLEVKGVKHISNMTDPRIPAALTPVVVGVKALHNFNPKPQHRLGGKVALNSKTGKWERVKSETAKDAKGMKTPAQIKGSGVHPLFATQDGNDPEDTIEDVTPYDFAKIYNVTPLWTSGITGSGQTIAIAGTSRINAADLTSFRSAFGLPAISSFTTLVGNSYDPGECGVNSTDYCTYDDQIENSLDVEWSGAVAKGASVVLVVSGYNTAGTNDAVYDSADYIIKNKTASILSASYGECELGMGTAGNVSYYNLWQTAAAEGISAFVSSGDSGSASCDDGGDSNGTPYPAEYGLSVSGMASTPYNTAVGGTDFGWCPASAINSSSSSVYTCATAAKSYWSTSNSSTTKANALGYVPEIPWNDTCSSPTGIAYAQYWASWLGVTNPTDSETACNFFVDYYETIYEDIYYEYGEEVDVSGFVDTIGGSGGKSNCVANDGSTVASCKSTITTTGTANGSIALYKDGWVKPTWQTGVTGIPSDGVRDIPDVSFFAADGMNNSAYLICYSGNDDGSSYPCSYSSSYSDDTAMQEVGGTSVSSPAMAGVMALINQKAGGAVGNPNAMLYKLAAKQTYASCSAESVTTSSSCYFNDIDKYTIAQPCDYSDLSPNCVSTEAYDGYTDVAGILSGYNATTGYDMATGLGSLNVANVVNAGVWSPHTSAVAVLSPSTLIFSKTLVGASSAKQTVTLKNTGTAALTVSGVSVTGTNASSFSQTNTCGKSVAASGSCTISVTFKPTKTGALTASISVADNASNSPQTVALSGTGTAPTVSLSSTSLSFGSIAEGGSATSQVTLKNTGTAALSVTGLTITGTNASAFSETNTCGSSVAVSSSCTINVTFKPVATGSMSAALSLADNASNSPQKITLNGKGTGPVVKLSVSSLSFGSIAAGSSSTQNVTLQNTGAAALSLTGITIAGANASAFTQTNKCPSSLAAGAYCTIKVTFAPVSDSSQTASLKIADNAGNSPQSVTLSGKGTGPVAKLSTTSLSYGSVAVNSSSALSVTFQNTGTTTLSLTGISIAGSNASSFTQSNKCPSTLATDKYCTIKVTFKPTKTGALTASLKFSDNAANSPQTVTLTGTGK